MFKKHIAILGFALMTVGVQAQDNLINKVKNNGTEGVENKFGFEVIINNEATSVKNQGRSGTCWSYSGNSFLESEILRKTGKSIDISEMYVVRKVYEVKGEKYIRMHGNLNFGQGGALHDPIDVLKEFGAVPEKTYLGLLPGQKINNHGEFEAVLKGILDAVLENNNGEITTAWINAYNGAIDAYLGEDVKDFTYEGKKYTPKSFAKDVLKIDANDYVEFTSMNDKPYNEKVFVEVPDNWSYGLSYNVELDDMTAIVDKALKDGYTVAWATDVSEKGFNIRNGVAIVPAIDYKDMTAEEKETMFDGPKTEKIITADLRQHGYDNWTTTDDHGMHITGLAKDKQGNEYYIVKNSWGTKYNNGYLYVSKAFFKYKTISFMLDKNALSKDIKKKLNI
jgi:bleomycin hydrolase